MALSGLMLYKFFTGSRSVDGATQNLSQAFTQVTAEKISKLLGGHGDVIVLMWGPPSDDAGHPGGPPDVLAMCQALQKACLYVVDKSSVPPVRVGSGTAWTVDNYRSVLGRYPQVAALVSFIGAPVERAERTGITLNAPETVRRPFRQCRYCVVAF
jgi:hypothetical protein